MNDTQTGLFNRSFGSGDRQVLAFHCTMAHSGAWRGVSAAMPEVTITAPLKEIMRVRSQEEYRPGTISYRDASGAEVSVDFGQSTPILTISSPSNSIQIPVPD